MYEIKSARHHTRFVYAKTRIPIVFLGWKHASHWFLLLGIVFINDWLSLKLKCGVYTHGICAFGLGSILVSRASRPRVSSLGPGSYGTGSARKLAVVSKAHALGLGRFSTHNNFHSEVLRRNEVFVLTYCMLIG